MGSYLRSLVDISKPKISFWAKIAAKKNPAFAPEKPAFAPEVTKKPVFAPEKPVFAPEITSKPQVISPETIAAFNQTIIKERKLLDTLTQIGKNLKENMLTITRKLGG